MSQSAQEFAHLPKEREGKQVARCHLCLIHLSEMLIQKGQRRKYYLFVKTVQLGTCCQDIIIQSGTGLKQGTKVTIPAA